MIDIGVDIVEIQRIAKAVRNPHFLKRIFTPVEVDYCRARKNAAQHFAVRFAAKEAVWKAIAQASIRLPSGKKAKASTILHRDIRIHNRADGKPEVVFPAPFARLATRVSISLSHGRDYAVAMAVYENP